MASHLHDVEDFNAGGRMIGIVLQTATPSYVTARAVDLARIAVNPKRNRFQRALPPAPTYDANGNQTNLTATGESVAWNANNQPVTINGITATYDALGRMVETGSGSTYKQFVFRPSGALLAVYSGGLVKGTVPLPGGDAAVYNASGLSYLRHTDWLGSSRFATTWNHAVYSKTSYAPFGETYNESGTADRSFTGQDQDVLTGSGGTGVYDFLYRKHDPSAGRWLSPDPAGWAAVDFTNPQTLNRYAYVLNNPLSLIDPNGLDACDPTSTEGGYDGVGDCLQGPEDPPSGFDQVGFDQSGNIIYMDKNGNIFVGLPPSNSSPNPNPDPNPPGLPPPCMSFFDCLRTGSVMDILSSGSGTNNGGGGGSGGANPNKYTYSNSGFWRKPVPETPEAKEARCKYAESVGELADMGVTATGIGALFNPVFIPFAVGTGATSLLAHGVHYFGGCK